MRCRIPGTIRGDEAFGITQPPVALRENIRQYFPQSHVPVPYGPAIPASNNVLMDHFLWNIKLFGHPSGHPELAIRQGIWPSHLAILWPSGRTFGHPIWPSRGPPARHLAIPFGRPVAIPQGIWPSHLTILWPSRRIFGHPGVKTRILLPTHLPK